jgi:hypothetical protein
MAKLIVSCVLAVLILALAPTALKAAPLCPLGNATLHGTYGVSAGGTIVGLGPAAGVGEITYDGRGNSSAMFTASFNGTIKTIPLTGTYTVNPDCTGTHVEEGSHYFFVVTPDGNRTWWIETDPGVVFSGTIVRLHPLESADEALRAKPTHDQTVPAKLRHAPKGSAIPESKTKLVSQRTVVAGKAS